MASKLEERILSLQGSFQPMAIFNCNDLEVVGDELWRTLEKYAVGEGKPFVLKNWHLHRHWDQSKFSFENLQDHFGDEKHVCKRQPGNQNDLSEGTEDKPEEVQDELLSIVEYIERIAPHLQDQSGPVSQPVAVFDMEEKLKSKLRKDQLRALIDQILSVNFARKEQLYAKDLSCPETWTLYLMKHLLPLCLTYRGVNDLIGLYYRAAIETLMVYIGDNGTFTPIHIDHCGVIGHNLMVEAEKGSSAMWFVIGSKNEEKARQYWKVIGHNLDLENHRASVEELRKAPFPIYVVQQHVGDLIVIPSKCLHQVNNIGGTTIKVAWNRITPNCASIALDHILPRYQKTLNPEMYRIKAVVHGAVQEFETLLTKKTIIPEMPREIYVKWAMALILLLRKMIESDAINMVRLKSQKLIQEDAVLVKPKELPFSVTASCDYCHADIWNRHIHCETDKYDTCGKCYSQGRGCSHRGTDGVYFAEFISHDHLMELYSRVVCIWNNSNFLFQVPGYSRIEDDLTTRLASSTLLLSEMSCAYGRHEQLLRCQKRCHRCCHERSRLSWIQCTNTVPRVIRPTSNHARRLKEQPTTPRACTLVFCENCLKKYFHVKWDEVVSAPGFVCPRCEERCDCRDCNGRRTRQPVLRQQQHAHQAAPHRPPIRKKMSAEERDILLDQLFTNPSEDRRNRGGIHDHGVVPTGHRRRKTK